MKFQIAMRGEDVDVGSVELALQAVDPAAMIDRAGDDDQLRIATYMTADELVAAIGRAGYPVTPDQIVRMPSECCGGCGG